MTVSIEEEFLKLKPAYERVGNNIVSALEQFLKEHGIQSFAISSRIKTFESFNDKIVRKNYENPFEDIEDFVGVRIVLYYQDEVELVAKVIDDEFDTKTSEDKSSELDTDKFGYRSYHKIVTIPEAWLETPNYRGLDNIKCEIQIRTILMHAWAEIEHKLQYKNEASVPTELKRKLFRLSAKLEEADEQFQELRNQASAYRESLPKEFQNKSTKKEELELNVDTIQVYLTERYPKRKHSTSDDYASLVEQLKAMNLASVGALDSELNKLEKHAIQHEKMYHDGRLYFRDTGMVRNSLDVHQMRGLRP